MVAELKRLDEVAIMEASAKGIKLVVFRWDEMARDEDGEEDYIIATCKAAGAEYPPPNGIDSY